MFYGIIVRMYNNGEHNPPHFHATYQGYNAVFKNFGLEFSVTCLRDENPVSSRLREHLKIY